MAIIRRAPNIRARPEDYPINDDNSPIKVVNFNGVGGSTVMYTAHWPRLHPSDFRVKTLDGVADDWPIDYDTLAPFFAENDRMMGVSGLSGDPLSPLTEPPMPPQPLGRSGAIIGKAMNKLGWHWWPSDTTVATMDYEGRARCINLGHCTPACAQGAKASTDITYWPAALRAGVELRTHCRVREITTNEHGMAVRRCLLRPGRRRAVPAGRSRDHRLQRHRHAAAVAELGLRPLPNGLANSSGLVGKNLMFHPYAQVYGYVEEPTDSNRAPPTCLWSKEFYDTDPSRGFVRGYAIQFGRGVGPVFEAVMSEAKGILPWGADHHRVFRKLNGHRLAVSAICEDLPEEHNRVTLDPVLKDSHGIPAPRVDYTISENTRKDAGARACARQRDPERRRRRPTSASTRPIPYGGWHLLGTARMGTDPIARW